MSDGIAAIRPVLREMLDAERDEPRRPDGSGGWCAHFSVKPKDGHWAEVVSDAVNFYYPYAGNPLMRLAPSGAPLPPHQTRAEWEGGKYATIFVGEFDLDAIARFVDWLFVTFYDLGPDYPLDVQLCRLV